jgi:hypothetical protein
MASPLIVVCIIAQHFLHPTPMDTGMGCTGPMSLDDAKTLVTANSPKARMGEIIYELHPHKAPLSPTPKPMGELNVGANPEMGRVRVHWDSATGGKDRWSGAVGEDQAVIAIDHYAREPPVRFTNPVVYDLVKAK